MEFKITSDKGKDVIKAALDKVGSMKGISIADKLSELPHNIKKSVTEGVVNKANQTKEFINSVKDKNARLRSLEVALKILDDEVIVSNKKNIVYRSQNGKLTIIDKDFWEDPKTVTIKEESSVTVKTIKYYKSDLFIYPFYNEKTIKGEEFYMEENEIWYKDIDIINVMRFKSNKPEITKIKIEGMAKADEHEIINFVKMRLDINRDKRISALLAEKNIPESTLIKVGKNFIIARQDGSIKAYYSNSEGEFCQEVILNKVPELRQSGFEALFSEDISSFCLKNGYAFGDFIQNEDYIEYWHDIGAKKVCLMRFKV